MREELSCKTSTGFAVSRRRSIVVSRAPRVTTVVQSTCGSLPIDIIRTINMTTRNAYVKKRDTSFPAKSGHRKTTMTRGNQPTTSDAISTHEARCLHAADAVHKIGKNKSSLWLVYVNQIKYDNPKHGIMV
jgi:hypothetical protein